MNSIETTLAVIPAEDPRQRLELVLCVGGALELRQQSYGEGVGWFTQSTIPVEPTQLNSLRAALGQGGGVCKPAPKVATSNWRPKLVLADIA
ncbi:MAG: hypothetical protein NXI22_00220 [bacterium]|nr:hypothetical protein [bacterium]